ncbi:MAG TPA: FkbM family methyltransferase [Gammaproteobacteria bacterium]|nr:FkbM family methyltransferase [Gammaproteobacteria bacterium]
MAGLKEILNDNLKSCKSNKYTDNHDFRRFGKINVIKKSVKKALVYTGVYKNHASKIIQNNIDRLSWLYDRLYDEESKKIFIGVLSFRVLGYERVRLPLNTREYWKKLEELESLAQETEEIKLGYFGWHLNKINLESEGYPVELFIRPYGIYAQFILQQYRCQINSSSIEVEEGDVVIDAGGCYGDTAINFALNVGESGRVYCWEFMPENIDIFKRNMKLNEKYSRRIELVENPLWSSSGKKLYISGVGPCARLSLDPPRDKNQTTVVNTYTVDDLCSDKGLRALNFIKMDIEGAELEALIGAENTIRKFKPKLAISVYHNIQDFWEIPQWIDSLGLGYRFYLRHFTIHAEETVLFAEVEK